MSLKKKTNGFILIELISALIVASYAITILSVWSASLIKQRTYALKKISAIATLISLVNHSSSCAAPSCHITEKSGICYTQKTISIALNQLDPLLGSPKKPCHFNFIEGTAAWLEDDHPIAYTYKQECVYETTH